MSRIGDYDIIAHLGGGAFGEVFKVRKNSKIFAMKKIHVRNQDEKDKVKKEVDSLKHLSHRNIIQQRAWFIISDHVYIVLEFCTGGSLNDKIINHYSSLWSSELLGYFKQLARGVEYLHDKDILHRDIKPDNILIQIENGQEVLKLADFGLARVWNTFSNDHPYYGFTYSPKGPPYYTAPEVYREHVTYASDIFSIGCVVMAIFSGISVPWIGGKPLVVPVFQGRSQAHEVSESTRNSFIREHIKLPCGNQIDLQNLVISMVRENWRNRPTASRIRSRIESVWTACNIL